MRRTKIVCTLGPSVDSEERIEALADAGMNVARLNFSHGTHQEHRQRIEWIRNVRRRRNQPLAIMLDTKGPEIRVGKLRHDTIDVEPGQILTLTSAETAESDSTVPVRPAEILGNLTQGSVVLFDDGYITSRVVSSGDEVRVEVQNAGTLHSGKGINVPDVALDLPILTDKDREDIRFGCSEEIDLVAASFVCGPENVLAIRKLLDEEGRSDVGIVAKIESQLGVNHFDAILHTVDGVMIARGDLGVEVPLAKVPGLQKMMIRRCADEAKPSIIATQMLESMIRNPRPTRAEANDVATGIYDSAGAVMLSGETAAGKYPIESVSTMLSIIEEAESDFDYRRYFQQQSMLGGADVPFAVARATLKTAYSTGASAIFIITSSGRTARLISRLRPEMPILALTPSRRAYHQLAFDWGLVPVYCESVSDIDDGVKQLSDWGRENGYIDEGDLVVVTAGTPFGVAGTTNMMRVESIGDVLARGKPGTGETVDGLVLHLHDPSEVAPEGTAGQILVLSSFDERFVPHLSNARGAVLQAHRGDQGSEVGLLAAAEELQMPVIVGADSACSLLKEGRTITIDPEHGLIYAGRKEE
jgi:pyruvate kinase